MADLNTVTWWEIPVPDLDEATAFYGAVFGWTFQPYGEDVVMVFNAGELIGALDRSRAATAGDGVAIYVNVPDLEASLAAITEAGGKIERERTEIGGDMGWWAEFRDPGGRWVGLCSSRAAV